MVKKINETVYDRIFVMDSDGNGVIGLIDGDFTKTLQKDKSSTSESITITEQSGGYYYVEFTPTSTGTYSYIITQATYQTEGWYNDFLVRSNSNDDIKTDTESIISKVDVIDGNVDTININLDTVSINILRLLGLAQENIYIDNQVYDSDNNLTSCRIRVYSVSGSVGTSSDVLATYNVTATYDINELLDSYKVVKQ